MKRFLLILAAWLLPVSASAQLRLDFDADAYYDPPAASTGASSNDRVASTETSTDKARSVRHGENTVRVAREAEAASGRNTRLAAAQSPY